MAELVVLSRFEVEPLLEARRRGEGSVSISLDLGLSQSAVVLSPDNLVLPDGRQVLWSDLQRVSDSKGSGRMSERCWVLQDGTLHEIRTFSRESDLHYSLMPTSGAPTMVISGFPMHRVKGTDPYQDTQQKIKAVAPIVGTVLDTATGLGYTAIASARTAGKVITIERDPAALEIARLNPWSQALFDNPKIEQRMADSFEAVAEFEAEQFTRIIHDPPAFSLAGDLYSGEMYRRLYRVLRRGGRLFHYIGDPESRSGARVQKGVIRRLQEAGFVRVQARREAFGVVAVK